MLPWSNWVASWDEGEARVTSPPVRQPARCCPRKRHVWGDEGKAVGCVPPTGCVLDADQRRRFAKCYRVTARLFRGAASSCFAGSLSAWDAGLGGASLNGLKAQQNCSSRARSPLTQEAWAFAPAFSDFLSSVEDFTSLFKHRFVDLTAREALLQYFYCR